MGNSGFSKRKKMKEFITESPLKDRSVPFYYQIVKLLRRMIEQGELTPGERLPAEMELSKSFGVSRVTVRQALSILKADGLLDRKHGNGTFVANSHTGPEKIKLTGIIEQNLSVEQAHRLISVEDVPPPPHLEEFFRISSHKRLTRIRRLRMVDEISFCYTISFLLPELANKVKRRDLKHRNMLDIIQNRLQLPLDKIRQTFEARTADSEIAGHLSIGILDPVFYVEGFVYGSKGNPILYTQMYHKGNRHKYSIELFSNGKFTNSAHP
tara:strand:- start:65 stop:868 length:804 start_codon:yes stop_codon:yes gene_type:complete